MNCQPAPRSDRVLLTGASGFVGHHCLDYFVERTDWNFVLLDSLRHRGSTQRLLSAIDTGRVRVLRHDLGAPIDPVLRTKILADGPIDRIVNFASDSHVDRSIEDPVGCCRNNFELMLSMLELARSLPDLRAFDHISTDEVYGEAPPDSTGHLEWDVILPSNPYSASKAAQESLALGWWRTYKLPIRILNIMNMIGERQDPEKFLPKTIRAGVRGETITVHCDMRDGVPKPGRRIYLHARNLADALVFLHDRRPTLYDPAGVTHGARPDRFHVCGEVEIDNLQLVDLVSRVLGVKIPVELIEGESKRPGYDRRYALDGSKLKGLGWIPPLTFEESVVRIVQDARRNPQWLS